MDIELGTAHISAVLLLQSMENPKKFQDISPDVCSGMCRPHHLYKILGIHMVHSYNMSDVRVSHPHPAMSSTFHVGVTNVVVMRAETLRILLTKQPLLG